MCTTPATQIGLPVGLHQRKATLFRLYTGLHHKPYTNASKAAIEPSGVVYASNDGNSSPRVKVRPSVGKGSGLFAVASIAAYTKILEDDALLSLAQGEDLPQLWDKYNLLPPELKHVFDELSLPSELATKEKTMVSKLEQRGYSSPEAQKMARVNSRWQANAFKSGASNSESQSVSQWSYSLFGTVARINHSCTPNACAHYRPSGTEFVYALRDIQAGEEIEIAYFDMTMAKSDRQVRARSWGFQCSCPACSRDGIFASRAYEERLSYVHQQLSVDYTMPVPKTLGDSTQKAIPMASSPEYPWLVIALPKLYLNAFHLETRSKGRTEQAREALMKVLEWEVKTTGSSSPSSKEKRTMLMDFDAGG